MLSVLSFEQRQNFSNAENNGATSDFPDGAPIMCKVQYQSSGINGWLYDLFKLW